MSISPPPPTGEVVDSIDQVHWTALKKLVNAVNAYSGIDDEGPVEALRHYVSDCEWEFFLAYREYHKAMSDLVT